MASDSVDIMLPGPRQVCSYPKLKLSGTNEVAVEYRDVTANNNFYLVIITFSRLSSLEIFLNNVKAESAKRKKKSVGTKKKK